MLLNIFIASIMMIITTFIHAGGISLVVLAVESHERNLVHRRPLAKLRSISRIVLLMFFFTLVEMVLWGCVYLYVGAIDTFEEALYFSTVTFTTLGYGDILLDSSWRLMAAFEAANGIIIFGISTAVVVATVQRIYFSHLAKRNP